MDGDLTFDGIKYISSKRASEISGYTQDYIGQLCRNGKVGSRRVGRSWFVREDSLLAYITASMTAEESVEDDAEMFARGAVHDSVQHAQSESASEDEILDNIEFEEEEATEAEPAYVYTNTEPHKSLWRGVVWPLAGISSLVGLVVFVGLASGGVFGNIALSEVHAPVNGYESSANTLFGVGINSVEVPEHTAYTRLPFFMASASMVNANVRAVDAKYTAQGGLSTVLSTTTPGLSSGTITDRGVYIVPSEGAAKDSQVILEIANSFSDEVTVSPHTDGGSGIIRPVFRDGRGSEYLYVLVPIDEN